jgi:hypothetical protein
MYRGIDNGRRVKKRISYSPVLFLPTNKNTEWSGLHGEKLEPKKFETIRDARDFIKKYDEFKTSRSMVIQVLNMPSLQTHKEV